MTAPTTAQTRPEHEADIVTEEMIDKALAAEEDFITDRSRMRAALRAVAPLIAARASALPWRDKIVRDAEREACAALLEQLATHIPHDRAVLLAGAADIRARGETT